MSSQCRAPDCKHPCLRTAERTKHELICYKFKTMRKKQMADGMKRIAEETVEDSSSVKRRRIDLDHDLGYDINVSIIESEDFHPPANDIEEDPETPNVPPVPKQRRPPRSITDHLPLPALGVFARTEDLGSLSRPATPPATVLGRDGSTLDGIWTLPNKFGISRRYFDRPTSIPDEDVTLTDLTDPLEAQDLGAELVRLSLNASDGSLAPQAQYSTRERALDIIYPHPNLSSFLMNNWFYRRGSIQKSKLDRSILVNDVILNPSFDPLEIAPPFNFNALDDLIVSNAGGIASPEQQLGTGWFKGDATIDIPASGQHPRTTWSVPGAYYRDMTQVIRHVLESPASTSFNYDGFEEWWQPPSTATPPSPKQRVYHNVYTADAFLQAEATLRASEPRNYTGPPRRVIGLMFWSDSTHLTDFGQASLHPIYMAFANQSKADRCHPNKRCLHHIAYMPDLPAELITFLTARLGKVPNSDLLAHLKQELFHAVWRLLLNEDFVKAHKDGMDVRGGDNIRRLNFLRNFTYSADCPERAMIGCIRSNGTCGCFKDKSKKSTFDLLGTPASRRKIIQALRTDTAAHRRMIAEARSLIYDKGRGVKAAEVEKKLKKGSWTPTLSAFSEKIGPLNPPVDVFRMLVCDRMHEWDSGKVKRIFTHLFRLLASISPRLVDILNQRFRDMPSFGSKVRKFPPSVAQTAQLAARDWENILICAIPAFTGILTLLPGCPYTAEQKLILDLLYIMGTFHSLSQLRLQTTMSLDLLRDATVSLGDVFRQFRETSSNKFKVKESQRETQARVRNQNNALQKQGSKKTAPSTESKLVLLNLNTIKNHQLEHYSSCIADFGTMDSYSTELGEREHCFSKMRFLRTNKNRQSFVQGMAREETIERSIGEMDTELQALAQEVANANETCDFPSEENLIHTPDTRYTIAESSREVVSIPQWLESNATDPAFKGFMPNLKDHILRRLRRTTQRIDDDFTYSLMDHGDLHIKHNELRFHQTMRINYTTYDIRRDSDSITTTHPNIMLLANEDLSEATHPYWYARVMKIFHLDVMDRANSVREYRRIDILWVRWYGLADWSEGCDEKQLLRLGYVEGVENGFGFVDPSEVIRGCFLLPLREFEHSTRLLDPPSRLASDDPDKGDYPLYQVIHWVDPDMFMRYCGGGPGHLGLPTCTTAWRAQPPALVQQAKVHPQEEDGADGYSSSPPEGDVDDYAPGLSDSDLYLE